MTQRNPSRAPTGTLKLSKRTVMLYTSTYDRTAKATRQTYVAGFSRSATDVPAAFMSALRRVVCDPERREAMLARIELEVLIPARCLAIERQERQARLAALTPLMEARRVLRRAIGCMAGLARSKELELEVGGLRAAWRELERQLPERDDECATHHADEHTDLDGAMCALCNAYKTLAQAVQVLPRGASINSSTVLAWRKSWYLHQDMLAVVTSRAALRRPAGWSSPAARARVEQGGDASGQTGQTGRTSQADELARAADSQGVQQAPPDRQVRRSAEDERAPRDNAGE